MFGKKLNEISDSYIHFATLYRAGLSVIQILEHFEASARVEEKFKARMIRQGIDRGKTLYEACQRAGIPPFDLELLRIGEETGRLPTFLDELSHHYLYRQNAITSIKQALIKPIGLAGCSLFLSPLPKLVRGDISLISYFFSSVGVLILFGLLIYFLNRLYIFSLYSKKWSHIRFSLLSSIPFVSKINELMCLEVFLSCLKAHIESGSTFSAALRAASKIINNEKLESQAEQAANHIESLGIYRSLSFITILSQSQLTIIQTGEVSGTLDKSLQILCKQTRANLDTATMHFGVILSKGLYGIGVIYVGYSILKDFLAITQVTDQFLQ